ncbi:MAG: hypothetical protein ABI782_12235 [Anaerolineaceae bacterium]
MTQDAMAEMMANWKKLSDQVVASWGTQMSAGTKSEEGATALAEMERAYLEMRTQMGVASRTAFEPLVSAAGGVPFSEFQRLADQVHTILLRMDRIDDALLDLRTARAPRPVAPVAAGDEPDEGAKKRPKAKKKG